MSKGSSNEPGIIAFDRIRLLFSYWQVFQTVNMSGSTETRPVLEDANPSPEGIKLLRNENDEKVYVVNTVLNYYQRKLDHLHRQATLLLPHHLWKQDQLVNARSILLKLWVWRGGARSSDNEWIYKNLEPRRVNKRSNKALATDMINFLEVENANLKVTFFTQECENTPSPVHESEAMKDVYVLLHQTMEDYSEVRETQREQAEIIDKFARSVLEIRNQVGNGFQNITKLLLSRESGSGAINVSEPEPVTVVVEDSSLHIVEPKTAVKPETAAP